MQGPGTSSTGISSTGTSSLATGFGGARPAAPSRYGDPDVIRGLARLLLRQAEKIEEEATHLTHKATHSPWSGVAADAMRHSVAAGVASLCRTAELHRVAARALDRHADEVARLEQLIATTEHTVLTLVAQARSRLSGVAGLAGMLGSVLPDAVDHFLVHFDPPPGGHKDWLTVPLPAAIAGAVR